MNKFPQKCFVILENEIKPRAKKLGMKPYEFCPVKIAATLSRLEYDGYYTRRDVRKILDMKVNILNDIF